MSVAEPFRVGFVLKRYPRYSETFIAREILAHEEAGLSLEIFSPREVVQNFICQRRESTPQSCNERSFPKSNRCTPLSRS